MFFFFFRLSLVGLAEEPRPARHVRSQDGPAGAFLPLAVRTASSHPLERREPSSVRRTAEGAEPTKTLQARGSSGAVRPRPTSQIFLVRARLSEPLEAEAPTTCLGRLAFFSVARCPFSLKALPLGPEKERRFARQAARLQRQSFCLPTGVVFFFLFPAPLLRGGKKQCLWRYRCWRTGSPRHAFSALKQKQSPNRVAVLKYPKKSACNVISEKPKACPCNFGLLYNLQHVLATFVSF